MLQICKMKMSFEPKIKVVHKSESPKVNTDGDQSMKPDAAMTRLQFVHERKYSWHQAL